MSELAARPPAKREPASERPPAEDTNASSRAAVLEAMHRQRDDHPDAAKGVLMISYAFPPAAYVGVHRTLKYCKYLRESGWHPLVVTIDPTAVLVQDGRLARELPPEVEVFRTRDIDPAKWLASRSAGAPRKEARTSSSAHERTSARDSSRPTSVTSRVKQFIRKALLESPDSHIFWVPFAFVKGIQILLTRRIDVIYSSSPPHSSHLAAWLLSKCFRKPHVADFRDPWFVQGSKRTGPPDGVFMALQAKLKRQLVTNAAKIVSVSAGEREELLAEFPDLHPSRVDVITNGYDPDDFSDIPTQVQDHRPFTITHAGTLYPEVGREFFEAIEQLITRRPDIGQQLRVNLLGKAAPEYQNVIERLARLRVVNDLGFQPHRAALAWMHNSDVLLILLGGNFFLPSHVPAKTFEYLFLGKPILAVAQPGDLTDILTKSGLGITVPPHDVAGLAATIEGLFTSFRAGRLGVQSDQAYISRFERRRLTQALAGLLDQVVAERRARYGRRAARGAR